MNLGRAINILNATLRTERPIVFSSLWIMRHTPAVYRYIRTYVRTENDEIDWDRVTKRLDRTFQKRWIRYRRKVVKIYEDQTEVDRIVLKYKARMYTLIVPTSPKDMRDRERIFIALVRISQKGNRVAEQELVRWLTFVVEEWIERWWQIRRWKGYTDDVEDKIKSCVRCYKYTGTFLGYLFKTLEYSSRALKSLFKYSLDDTVFEGDETKINFLIHDQQTL